MNHVNQQERRKAIETLEPLSLEWFDLAVSPDIYWTDGQPRIAILRTGERQPRFVPIAVFTVAEAARMARWLRRTIKQISDLYPPEKP